MKIVALADLHGHLPAVEPCDLLLLAGDICPNYTGRVNDDQLRQAVWLDTKFRHWLAAAPAGQIVGIWGNHDFVGERSALIPQGLNWRLLQDSEMMVGGLRIYGTPWTPTFFRWAFMQDEENLEAIYAQIPEGLDILLAHGPPYGYRDTVARSALERCGSKALLTAVSRANPRVLICGHIHGGHGIGTLPGGGAIRNVAHVDEAYRPRVRTESFVLEPVRPEVAG